MNQKDYPLIGVVPSYQLDEDALIIPNRYMNALAQSDAIPLVLPLASSSAIQEALLPNFDGFLLSGGQDIDPRRYGESVTGAHLSEFCSQREETEHLILDFAKRYDIPVLGICRGMQAMNVSCGGTLYQDIDAELSKMPSTSVFTCDACPHYAEHHPTAAASHVSMGTTSHASARDSQESVPVFSSSHCQINCYHIPTHEVSTAPDSQLQRILGCDPIAVNSMHHQAIKKLGEGLTACAHDPEGLVEAIESPALSFFLGVQWHPEFFANSTMQPLFSAFVEAATSCRQQKPIMPSHMPRTKM